MSASTAESLQAALSRLDSLQECLLHDIRLEQFGYGIDLLFNQVRDDNGVRADVVENPRIVTLRLLGVESLRFTGGLTAAMKSNPEQINWGLSEISHARSYDFQGASTFSAEWEGDRRLKVEFTSFQIIYDQGSQQESPTNPPSIDKVKIWWELMCDSNHRWTVDGLDGVQLAAKDALCPIDGLPAVTVALQRPADRVSVTIVPATRIVDEVTDSVGHESEYYLEISSADETCRKRSSMTFGWDEAVKKAGLFQRASWDHANKIWERFNFDRA